MNKPHSSRHSRFVDFRAIKDQVSFEQVLQHYGLRDRLTGQGDSLRGCCPIHHGTNPTQFSVSLSKNCWHCHSDCAGGGNVLDFIARMEDCSVHDAALKAIGWFHLKEPESQQPNREDARTQRPEPKQPEPKLAAPPVPIASQPTEPRSASPQRETNHPLGFELQNLDGSHPYLAERGLKPETIAEFGLGLCNAGKTVFGRIAIPLHNWKGELVGYVGRWPGEPPTPETPKYKLPKGFRKSAELFNLHRALRESAEAPLYLVEGVFDVLHLWQHGQRKVVALLGSSLSAEQEALLFDRTPFAPQLVLLLDADDAGRKGTAEMLARLAPRTFVKVVALPREGMQPEHLTPAEITSLPYPEEWP